MKLNLGSGYRRYEGFTNVDGDHNCSPDYIVDLEKGELPFEDNSIDEIIAEHILEHIGEGYIPLLKEIYRVCKQDAIIHVVVPHHFHETFLSDPTHKRPITVEGFNLFSKKRNQFEIENKGHASTLGIIYNVDFEVVGYNFTVDPFYENIIDNQSQEQNQRLSREVNNFFMTTEITLKVIK